MNKPTDYAEVDAQVFKALDKAAEIKALEAKATQVCANEGCASKWNHTNLCSAAWILVMEAKRGNAA